MGLCVGGRTEPYLSWLSMGIWFARIVLLWRCFSLPPPTKPLVFTNLPPLAFFFLFCFLVLLCVFGFCFLFLFSPQNLRPGQNGGLFTDVSLLVPAQQDGGCEPETRSFQPCLTNDLYSLSRCCLSFCFFLLCFFSSVFFSSDFLKYIYIYKICILCLSSVSRCFCWVLWKPA